MESIKLIKKYINKLNATEPSIIREQLKSELPIEHGVYMFMRKRSKHIDYVGTATGKNGLKQRVKQHLSPSYDKSVFRIKLSEDKSIPSLTEQVEHLKRHYLLLFIPIIEHKSIIMAIEQVLIFEKGSIYNNENFKT
jgi:hypothetical protein